MDYKYIDVPNNLSFNDIKDNNFCFAPSKYTRFYPKNNIQYKSLGSIIKESNQKEKILRKKVYKYSEIGDIDIYSGIIDNKEKQGYYMNNSSIKSIKKDDILISTVRTYRGGIGIVTDTDENLVCSSAIMVLRELKDEIDRYYILAVLKSKFFIEQILGFQNRGLYPRLDKESMDYVQIPIPKQDNLIKYISMLMKAYINKQKLIREKYNKILKIIDNELLSNQNKVEYSFQYPKYDEILTRGRLDTNLYKNDFREIENTILNYKNGYKNVYELGFTMSRGQNLQVSSIGKSIYSKSYHEGYYRLILPKYISKYGIVDTVEYLGNRKKLKTLSNGDLVFGAEGFEKGRSLVILDDYSSITNIHGIVLKNNNVKLSIFLKCILDYLRDKGLIDLFAVGGNGGSLAQQYWNEIPIPNFNYTVQNNIISLYYNFEIKYNPKSCTIDSFENYDNEFNCKAGIYNLDRSSRKLKKVIDRALDKIIKGEDVTISFDFDKIEK